MAIDGIGLFSLVCPVMILHACSPANQKPIMIDETGHTETVEQVIEIDKVWAGHLW
jgi:hypothetical protein